MLFWAFATVAALLLPLSAQAEPVRELRFIYADGLIWLKVECVGRKESLNFILDSGASVSAIDLRTAQACGVRLDDRQWVTGVSGRSSAYVVKGLQVKVGGAALTEPVLALDLGAISQRCHRPVDGILGVDFFRKNAVRIDFNAEKIWLLKGSDVKSANGVVLPIKMRNGAFCVPLRIAGKSELQWMRLDTGCDSALEWVVTGTEKQRMNEPSIGLETPAVQYIKTSAWLGNRCFSRVTAGVHTKSIFPREDGLVGNGLLSKLCVTIDEQRSRVIFERAR